jgi:hypothetical protein
MVFLDGKETDRLLKKPSRRFFEKKAEKNPICR